ncbi:MAG: alpha/beta hydrolase [Dehalococcoidia bacterium]|nr:alpha/beta hydrolase [Dehalococcoidia bacterium]
MPFVTANGFRHYYKITGDGEPIVQIHGAALGHSNFAKVTPLLAQRYRVIDFDLPGYGQSDKPTEPIVSLEAWADDVALFMDALNLPKAHIHATSFGGMIGVIFAAKYPEKTHTLVASCFMTRYDEMARARVRVWRKIALAAGMVPELADAIMMLGLTRQYIETDEGRDDVRWLTKFWLNNTPEQFAAGFTAMEQADLEPYLPKIQAPTLLQCGALDQMTPLDAGASGVGVRKASTLIPNARLQIIEQCAHLNLVEKPHESAEAILQFLAEHPLRD